MDLGTSKSLDFSLHMRTHCTVSNWRPSITVGWNLSLLYNNSTYNPNETKENDTDSNAEAVRARLLRIMAWLKRFDSVSVINSAQTSQWHGLPCPHRNPHLANRD